MYWYERRILLSGHVYRLGGKESLYRVFTSLEFDTLMIEYPGMRVRLDQDAAYVVSGGVTLGGSAFTTDNEGIFTYRAEAKDFPIVVGGNSIIGITKIYIPSGGIVTGGNAGRAKTRVYSSTNILRKKGAAITKKVGV